MTQPEHWLVNLLLLQWAWVLLLLLVVCLVKCQRLI
jgi:hypothetical protein